MTHHRKQAAYIGVPAERPCEPEHYGYCGGAGAARLALATFC